MSTIAVGDAQIAIWRYKRTEPLPVTRVAAARGAPGARGAGRARRQDLRAHLDAPRHQARPPRRRDRRRGDQPRPAAVGPLAARLRQRLRGRRGLLCAAEGLPARRQADVRPRRTLAAPERAARREPAGVRHRRRRVRGRRASRRGGIRRRRREHARACRGRGRRPRPPDPGSLGLGNVLELRGVPPAAAPVAHGRLATQGPGKDSTTGHWELMGAITPAPQPTYPDGFPADVVSELERATGHSFICNRPYGGLAVIADYGPEHLETARSSSTRRRTRSCRSPLTTTGCPKPTCTPSARLRARSCAASTRSGGSSRARSPARRARSGARRVVTTTRCAAGAHVPAGAAGGRRAGPRRRQGPGPLLRRGHRPRPPGRDQRPRARRDARLVAELESGLVFVEPRRDRHALRPSQGRRGLPRGAARDRHGRRRLARRGWSRSRPPRHHRRSRLRPGRAALRPHARVRAAARPLRRPRRPPPRRRAGRRRRERAALAHGRGRTGAPWHTVRRLSDAMPELPEVETIRRRLAPLVEGRRLRKLEILDPRWCEPLRRSARRRPRRSHDRARWAGAASTSSCRGDGRGVPAHAPAHDRHAALRRRRPARSIHVCAST